VILPDVNVLVYAFRREATDHEQYREWLIDVLSGSEDLALVDPVLLGFVRIVTNPRIFQDPAPTGAALEFVDALRSAVTARPVSHSDATWDQLARCAASDRQVRGNLVPDAFLAATAITTGARLATADAGFARFADLRWFDPGGPAGS
jgi:toxin-antitoxin system PIN domain toxin